MEKTGKPLVVKPKRTKNRPQWRVPDYQTGRRDAVFPGYQSRFGDGVNRVQCSAVARSTGTRCRNDSLHGASRCRVHGGHQSAMRASGVAVSIAASRRGRRVLAAIGCGPVPDGLTGPLPDSPVARGRLFESYRNRTSRRIRGARHETRWRNSNGWNADGRAALADPRLLPVFRSDCTRQTSATIATHETRDTGCVHMLSAWLW